MKTFRGWRVELSDGTIREVDAESWLVSTIVGGAVAALDGFVRFFRHVEQRDEVSGHRSWHRLEVLAINKDEVMTIEPILEEEVSKDAGRDTQGEPPADGV